MAKEQNLSLNPVKISGVCGRLMCCLKNEEEVYEELNRKLPSVGDAVETPDELHGSVSSVNILKQLVKVVVDLPNDEKEVREYPVSEIRFHSRKKNRGKDSREKEPEAKDIKDTKDTKDRSRSKGRGRNRDGRKGTPEEGSLDRSQDIKETTPADPV